MKSLNHDVIEVFDRELDAYGEALIALEHDYDEPNILSLGDRVQELLKPRSELPRQELMERLREELGKKLLEKQKLETALREELRKKLLENRELNEQKLEKLQNEEPWKKLNGRLRIGIKMANSILIITTLIIGLVAGFLIGRRFPERNYVRWEGSLLYDTTTGEICDPVLARPDKVFPHCK